MQSKDWYQSTTVWGSILAVVAPLIGMILHQQIPSDLVQQIADALAAIGGVIAIIGRLRATTMISAPTKGPTP